MKKMIAWVTGTRMYRAFVLYSGHDGPNLADSVTYRALFSTFASILLGFSLAGLWIGNNAAAMSALGSALNQIIPGIGDIVDTDALSGTLQFTLTGIFSLVGLVFAAVGAARSLQVALHTLAGKNFTKPPIIPILLRDLAVSFGFLLLVGLAALATLATSLGLGNIAEQLGASTEGTLFNLLGRIVGALVIFGIDMLAIAGAFVLLSGMKAPRRILWSGAALGAVGLLFLQEFSGLFVSGAGLNPLLASFAALIVLLLWINLSIQVILLASAWIMVATWEKENNSAGESPSPGSPDWRVAAARARYNLAKHHLERVEDAVQAGQDRPGPESAA